MSVSFFARRTIERYDVWPFTYSCTKVLTNRVLACIHEFFVIMFFIAKTGVEEIPLTTYAMPTR